MKNFIKNILNKSRNLNILEIAILKIYLISVSIIISIIFPVILGLNLIFYIILFLILYLLTFFFLFKKEGNFIKKVFFLKGYKIFLKYSLFDFSLFKLTIVSFGILLSKLFPIILTYNIGIYLTVFGFGAGYFVGRLLRK